MRKFDYIVAFLTIGLSTTVLFQNCGGNMSAKQSRSVSFANQGQEITTETIDTSIIEEENPTIPALIANRIISLNNKVTTGALAFDISAGDHLMFETNYMAVTKSTLVTLGSNGAGSINLSVDADNCTDSKSLALEEAVTFFSIFSNSFSQAQQKISLSNESTTPGCGFPRVVMDNMNPLAGDTELYFSKRDCTPNGELYLVDGLTPGRASMVRLQLENFFKTHIDQLCH